MTRAVNDATLQKAGDIYQYLIALRDCFELNDGDTLQIETNGDVSIINDAGGRFQREVKHHFGNKSISDRDIDFWKTLANWYVDYERVKNFSNYILSTTATIQSDSPFHNWNNIKKTEKLKRLKDIGAISKENEETFRNQYNRIFGDSYDESRLLAILDKFTIEAAKTSIDGISNEFSKYVGHIPSENRDGYIGALLGEILIKVKEPPYKWEVTKPTFDGILQIQSSAYGSKGTAPLPNEYAKAVVPKDNITTLEQKKFVASIREIKYDKMISNAMSDYWKADLTVAKYFRDNPMYLESLESYMEDLSAKMQYSKANSDINAEGATEEEQIRISKQLYNGVMSWDANDFGSIIRNQGYFQRGVIHNISHKVELGTDVFGNLQRLDNSLEGLPKRLEIIKDNLEETKKQFETAKIESQKEFPQEAELQAKIERLAEVDALLNMDKKDHEGADLGEPDENEIPLKKVVGLER